MEDKKRTSTTSKTLTKKIRTSKNYDVKMKKENTFIIHTETMEQETALKEFADTFKLRLEVADENFYDPDFVAKIQESRIQVRTGKTVQIDLDDIWKE